MLAIEPMHFMTCGRKSVIFPMFFAVSAASVKAMNFKFVFDSILFLACPLIFSFIHPSVFEMHKLNSLGNFLLQHLQELFHQALSRAEALSNSQTFLVIGLRFCG